MTPATPSPEEIEAVAKAISDVLPISWQRGDAQKELQVEDCVPLARAAIQAYRSVRPASGEVEGLITESLLRAGVLREVANDTYSADLITRLATALDRINREGSHE